MAEELLLEIREVLTDEDLTVEARWFIATRIAFSEKLQSAEAPLRFHKKVVALAGWSRRKWNGVLRELSDDKARMEGRPAKKRNKQRDAMIRKLLRDFPTGGKPN